MSNSVFMLQCIFCVNQTSFYNIFVFLGDERGKEFLQGCCGRNKRAYMHSAGLPGPVEGFWGWTQRLDPQEVAR